MLRNPEFDSKDVDPDLHKRLEKAVHDGRIKCFNMREGRADGDQDLNFWTRELEDVVREIMEDPVFKGNQNFHFELGMGPFHWPLFCTLTAVSLSTRYLLSPFMYPFAI